MTTEKAWEPEEEEQVPEDFTHDSSIEAKSGALTKPRSIYDLGHEPTTSIILIDSDKHDYGEIRVVVDFFSTGYKEGELIGYWNRVPYDGLIHGQMTTPISAIRDKGIQIYSAHAKRRKAQEEGKPVPDDVRGEVKVEFDGLRAKLMAAK